MKTFILVVLVSLWTLFLCELRHASAAETHDTESPYHWWSYSCCNEKDCGAAEEGTVKVTNEGYEVTLPSGKVTKLEWGDSRIKEKPADNPYAYDGRHHVCMFYSAYGNEWYLRCLYPSIAAY